MTDSIKESCNTQAKISTPPGVSTDKTNKYFGTDGFRAPYKFYPTPPIRVFFLFLVP